MAHLVVVVCAERAQLASMALFSTLCWPTTKRLSHICLANRMNFEQKFISSDYITFHIPFYAYKKSKMICFFLVVVVVFFSVYFLSVLVIKWLLFWILVDIYKLNAGRSGGVPFFSSFHSCRHKTVLIVYSKSHLNLFQPFTTVIKW